MTSNAAVETWLSRRDLETAVAEFRRSGEVTDAAPAGPTLVVASATSHLDVRRGRRGEVRRAEVWTSPAGVVALPWQDGADEPGPVVALPPYDSHQVWVSALGLDPGSRTGDGPRRAPGGVERLVRSVVEGDLAATLVVVDHETAERSTRWVVCDGPDGRVADLDAPRDVAAPLDLLPISPLSLAGALSASVASAVSSTTPLVGTGGDPTWPGKG